MESIEYIILCNMFFLNVLVVPKTDDSKQKIASPRPTEKKKIINLFVTTKIEFSNSPILEFKVLHKSQRAF